MAREVHPGLHTLDLMRPEGCRQILDAIEAAGVQSVKIRSPLTCELQDGICVQCYGRDLARGTQENTGEAVGMLKVGDVRRTGPPSTSLLPFWFSVRQHLLRLGKIIDKMNPINLATTHETFYEIPSCRR